MKTLDISPDDLVFGALGGAEDIGMNMFVYGHDHSWLIVDFGIMFGNETTAGADVLMPDIRFLEEHKNQLVGIVITHTHEDHFGAIPYLAHKLKCPIYAAPYGMKMIEAKLTEAGFYGKVDLRIFTPGSRKKIGPFDLEFIHVTHSIPQSNMIAIRTKAGNVLHTGDFKFDPEPLNENATDFSALEKLGKEGVLAVIADSTGAMSEKEFEGSETIVRKNLVDVIKGCKEKIAITCFSTNVTRIESIALAAKQCGRKVALAGLSLWRTEGIARELGYLKNVPPFLDDEEALDVPENQILYICTGSQGEPRSVLSRVAENLYRTIKFHEGDTVIYSAREIPGNEMKILNVRNNLADLGIKIITPEHARIHVSGHAHQEELQKLYTIIKPDAVLPVHGEKVHLNAHVLFAKSIGISHAFFPRNGELILLKKRQKPHVIGHLPTGVMALDGTRLIPFESEIFKNRRRIHYNGVVFVTVVCDKHGTLKEEPEISTVGFFEDPKTPPDYGLLIDAIEDAFEMLDDQGLRNKEELEEAIRVSLRRVFKNTYGKKPTIVTHILRK